MSDRWTPFASDSSSFAHSSGPNCCCCIRGSLGFNIIVFLLFGFTFGDHRQIVVAFRRVLVEHGRRMGDNVVGQAKMQSAFWGGVKGHHVRIGHIFNEMIIVVGSHETHHCLRRLGETMRSANGPGCVGNTSNWRILSKCRGRR